MNSWQLRQAVQCIKRGGIIAYPTEAVYGLGCDPLNANSVYRLLALKNRSDDKGLILIASDLEQLRPYLVPLNDKDKKKLLQTWPGPHTWTVPANPATPRWITGHHASIAVRVTAHPVASRLCKHLGFAIVSTSANPAAHPPARSALQVRQYFNNRIDYILSGKTSALRTPTPITDLRSGQTIRN